MEEQPPSQPPSEPTPTPDGPDWGEAKQKLMGATGADRLILIAGLVFFIDSFLPWYGIDLGPFGGANISGWDAGALAVLAIIFAILAAAFAAGRVLGWSQPIGGANDGIVYLVLGGAAFVFVLLRWLTEMDFTKFGLFIALIAGAVLAYGGWMKYKSAA